MIEVGEIAVLLLGACAPAKPAATPAPSVPAATAAPSQTAVPTDEPAGVGVPAFEYTDYGTQLAVVSSLSGKPLPGFESKTLGQDYSYAFASDGHMLAVASAGQLYLVDLPAWTIRQVDIELFGWISVVAFSRDGARVAVASGEPDAGLRLIDTKSATVTASAQAGFAVRNASFTSDGKALMVYGPRLALSGQEANVGVSTGAPKAELLSLTDLHPLWSVDLNGIRDGTFPKQPNTPDLYQPGVAWHYSPAIAFATQADMLYAVHGDEDKLTTVDFTRRKVSTVGIQVKTSWLDQLLAMTADVAHAKGEDGTTKQGMISPDGKHLYVIGTTSKATKNGDNWEFTFTPLGLEVVAVEDGTLEQKVDSQATMAQLSPDGQHIFLQGWNQDSSTPWTDIYDAASGKMIKHMDGLQLTPVRRLDGVVMLESSAMLTNSECDMAAVDAISFWIVSSWSAPQCVGWMGEG